MDHSLQDCTGRPGPLEILEEEERRRRADRQNRGRVRKRNHAAHQLWLYFVSFCIVGSYWIQHTVLFGSLRSIDRPMTVLNLLYLLPVTLLPFVTQVIGAHRNAWWGVALFSAVIIAGVVVSTVDIGAGISVFLLMPAIFVYNYLRAPEQSR